ncbi:hypothetical protein D9M73_202140 [compost metagenome]
MFGAQFVDPRLAEDDGDPHAKPQAQAQQRQQPQRAERGLEQGDADRAQAETQQIDSAPGEMAAADVDQKSREHHAGGRDGRDDADFQCARPRFMQAQRHQRQAGPQTETHDRNSEQ